MRRHKHDLGRFELLPSEIRFTQDSVAMTFQDGNKLNETCEDIVKGTVQVTDIPSIRVLEKNGIYYSVDNRRLYVLRVLEQLDFLTKITVRLISEHDRDITTKNDGCHVFLRQQMGTNGQWMLERTYLHCFCYQQQNKARKPVWWNEYRKCHKDQENRVIPETTNRSYRPNINTTSTRHAYNFRSTQRPYTGRSAHGSYESNSYVRPVAERRSNSNTDSSDGIVGGVLLAAIGVVGVGIARWLFGK